MKLLIFLALAAAGGCGKGMGDSSIVSSDCDPGGNRQWELSQKDG